MKRTFTSLHRLFVEAGMGDKWGLVEDHLLYWTSADWPIGALAATVDEDEVLLIVGEAFGELPAAVQISDARKVSEWVPREFLVRFHARYREPSRLGRKMRSAVGQALEEAYRTDRKNKWEWQYGFREMVEAMLTAYIKLILLGNEKMAKPLGDLLTLQRKALIMYLDSRGVEVGINPQTFLLIGR